MNISYCKINKKNKRVYDRENNNFTNVFNANTLANEIQDILSAGIFDNLKLL